MVYPIKISHRYPFLSFKILRGGAGADGGGGPRWQGRAGAAATAAAAAAGGPGGEKATSHACWGDRPAPPRTLGPPACRFGIWAPCSAFLFDEADSSCTEGSWL